MIVKPVDEVLDYRHDNGTNMYLVKSSDSRKFVWITEDKFPANFDEKLFMMRQLKGNFAKSRVFGNKIENKDWRKAIYDKSEADAEGSESESSSGEESETNHGEHPVSKVVGSEISKSKEQLDDESLLNSLSALGGAISAIVSTVSARTIGNMVSKPLPLDEEELNMLFRDFLYSKDHSGSPSIQIQNLLDLLWVLVISDNRVAFQQGRSDTLEQLCLVAHNLNDSMVSRQFIEMISKLQNSALASTSSAGGLSNLHIFSKLCDLVIEARVSGVEVSLSGSETGNSFQNQNHTDHGEDVSRPSSPQFHYTSSPFTSELSNDGIRELVLKIYQWKNPEKLADLPSILEKYKYQLSSLFVTLMRKYNVSYSDLKDSREFVPIEKKMKILRDRLTEIFTLNEPSKLVDLTDICNYWIHRETTETAEFIRKLESAYARTGEMRHGGATNGATNYIESLSPSGLLYRELIQEAMAMGNFDNYHRVDTLLERYRGRENYLYLSICDKYKMLIDDAKFSHAEKLRLDEQAMVRSLRMKKILELVYQKHNPDKLREVDKLASKYSASELFALIVKKYDIGAAEKVKYLIEAGETSDQSVLEKLEKNDYFVNEIFAGLMTALRLETSSDQNTTGPIVSGTPSQYLLPLFNPLSAYSIDSAEIIVRGISSMYLSHGSGSSLETGTLIESQLREQIQNRVVRVLEKLYGSSTQKIFDKHVSVTSQEPGYFDWHAHHGVEHLRASCLVSVNAMGAQASANLVPAVIQSGLIEYLTNPSSTPGGIDAHTAGNVRMHTVLHSSSARVTVFAGDYAVLAEGDVSSGIAASRSQIKLWAGVDSKDALRIVEMCLHWPRWLTQATLVVDENSQTVSVVGSLKHRVSFKKGCEAVQRLLKTSAGEPYVKMSVPREMVESSMIPAVSNSALPPQLHEWSDASFHESGDDLFSGDASGNITKSIISSSETFRPLKLTRTQMRDAYLQGQLCLNCDDTTHKPTECVLKRKVCWNCHGAHSGTACALPCRFCKAKHLFGILECVKKGAKRFAEWSKSRTCAEEKGLVVMVEDILDKMEKNDPNDASINTTVRNLTGLGIEFDLMRGDVAGGAGVTVMSPVVDKRVDENFSLKNSATPVSSPSAAAPPLPDAKYKWMERLFIEDVLKPTVLLGRDPMRLIMSQKGSAIKQMELRENCKIAFKGAVARDVFGASSSAVDFRFHAIIMCESPSQGFAIRKSLRDMLSQLELAVEEGMIARPQPVEGFAFLEKSSGIQDNLFQFDFLNQGQEINLSNKFECIGDLRHWLHQKGVEVELGDNAIVKLPGTGKISSIVDEKISKVDTFCVAVFNAFFELVTFWPNAQYWFEPFELVPVGLLSLTEKVSGASGDASFESGQVVALSEYAIAQFATLLVQSGLIDPVNDTNVYDKINQVLRSVKGVVRTSACDVRLLMYLKYPWELSSSSGAAARDVPESFDDVNQSLRALLNAKELRRCGRLGCAGDGSADILKMVSDESLRKGIDELIKERTTIVVSDNSNEQNAAKTAALESVKPGDSLLRRLTDVPEGERPYLGYIVDWVTPVEISNFLSMSKLDHMEIEPIESEESKEKLMVVEKHSMVVDEPLEEDLQELSVAVLRDRLKALDLPLTGRKVDLIERLQAHKLQQMPITIDDDNSPRSVDAKQVGKSASYKCIFELPRALMKWGDLVNNLTGPNNSHFNHVKQQCQSANVICAGSSSAALVGEARLHVELIATDSADFRKAKSLVEDLVRAVVDVGIDVCLGEESAAVKASVVKEVKVIEIAP